jgi:hypothetical protein
MDDETGGRSREGVFVLYASKWVNDYLRDKHGFHAVDLSKSFDKLVELCYYL